MVIHNIIDIQKVCRGSSVTPSKEDKNETIVKKKRTYLNLKQFTEKKVDNYIRVTR